MSGILRRVGGAALFGATGTLAAVLGVVFAVAFVAYRIVVGLLILGGFVAAGIAYFAGTGNWWHDWWPAIACFAGVAVLSAVWHGLMALAAALSERYA